MRLICPNCETEYEVHENMIPAEGRDVQCSNCMKTWFQSGPTKAAPEVESDLKLDRNRGVDAAPSKPQAAQAEPSRPQSPAVSSPSDFEDENDDSDLSSLPPAAVAAMARGRQAPKVGDSALDVIRDEVVREQTARKSEASPLETQIDLGIDETPIADTASATRDRMRTSAETVRKDIAEDIDDVDLEAALDEANDTFDEPTTKSERLPDIEEINSTLSDAPEYDDFDDDFAPEPARHPKSRSRSGFRLGFGLMLLISAALVGLYVYAPAISGRVPAMIGFLDGYVNIIDAIRVWLDRSAQDLVDQITKLLGTVNAG